MNIIEVENLDFCYYSQQEDDSSVEIPVLKNISFTVPKGQFLAVLGHNGSGKSTLAKHFNGILTPVKGRVLVHGIDTADDERIYDIRQNVGMVFQNPDNQLVATIVEEDVAFALENLGIPSDEIRKRVDKALETVGMSEFKMHSPHQLSGGQKQRIAIAGVIAMLPECLVLDEPTAMLDPQGRKEIMKTIKTLNHDHGITVVLITHYMEEAAQADRVMVMDDGVVILDDVPEKIFTQVDRLKSVGLDVPQVTELATQLKKSGVDIPTNLLSVEETAKTLARLMKGQLSV